MCDRERTRKESEYANSHLKIIRNTLRMENKILNIKDVAQETIISLQINTRKLLESVNDLTMVILRE